MTESLMQLAQIPVVRYRYPNTLASIAEFCGVGVHTGRPVTMQLVPADPGTGIVFKRIDLPGKPLIPAKVDYILDTSRCTTIGNSEAKVSTIEHLMAALAAFSIDNLLIELDGPEIPIGDGSSLPFVEVIKNAGVVSQSQEEIPVYALDAPIYHHEPGVQLIALPSEKLRISYTLHYPDKPIIGTQFYDYTTSQSNFIENIAASRTFALYDEVQLLQKAGLIKGGNLENAIVIEDDCIHANGGLRFPDELVRHKVLDLIGDLTLVGASFCAHIISICSGHRTNAALSKKLFNYFFNTEND